jgi:hypothetical protein
MKRTGVGLAALFALVTACDDSTVGPGAGDLADADAALIAEQQADLLDGILDGEINARPALIGAGEIDGTVSLSVAPIVTEFTFTRTRPCRNGGQVVASGAGTHTANRETGEVTLEFSGDKSIENCARARGDLVITINGEGTFEGFRKKVNGHFEGPQTNSQEGHFTWETSDGRSGECDYELTVTWDPATHTKTIVGFVCDHEINRTVTRDGAAGNDRGGDG